MGVSASGQESVDGERCIHACSAYVAIYLTASQTRAALCTCRAIACESQRVYTRVLKAYSTCALADKGFQPRAKTAYKQAGKAGGEYRALFWSLQKDICERCRKRRACVRKPCRECRGNEHVRGFRGSCDICCRCTVDVDLPQVFAERLAKMRAALTAWELALRHSPSARLLRHLARLRGMLDAQAEADCGGLLILKASFDDMEHGFWSLVQIGRSLRLARDAALDACIAQCGRRTANDVAQLGLLDGKRNEGAEKKVRSTYFPDLHAAALQVLRRYHEAIRSAPPKDEETFFKLERAWLAACERVATFLQKLIRLRARVVLGEVVHSVKLLQPRLQVRLDAAAQLLVGYPLSDGSPEDDGEAVGSDMLVRTLGRQIMSRMGLPALDLSACAAADLAEGCSQGLAAAKRAAHTGEDSQALDDFQTFQDRRCYSSLWQQEHESGRYRGFTFGEVWAGDPAFVYPPTVYSRGDHQQMAEFKRFHEAASRLDPRQPKVVAWIQRQFSDRGGEQEYVEELKVESKAPKSKRPREEREKQHRPLRRRGKRGKRQAAAAENQPLMMFSAAPEA
eukprot:TRINITY_DN47366_c0_g1_i1.p1 TRINITY_DN47366_c0_g1~~TRINITY_DN47366_c0_g1_i1.p1  ORF type:complete len:567 (+),score=116.90 TRINITY_DN47366_c0_g1_i1:65-1765(+)